MMFIISHYIVVVVVVAIVFLVNIVNQDEETRQKAIQVWIYFTHTPSTIIMSSFPFLSNDDDDNLFSLSFKKKSHLATL